MDCCRAGTPNAKRPRSTSRMNSTEPDSVSAVNEGPWPNLGRMVTKSGLLSRFSAECASSYARRSLSAYSARSMPPFRVAREHNRRRTRRFFFHGQNVYLGQRSPIMRIFLFLLFCVWFFQCAMRYPSTPYLQVTLPRLFLGYSGRFIRPIVCA